MSEDGFGLPLPGLGSMRSLSRLFGFSLPAVFLEWLRRSQSVLRPKRARSLNRTVCSAHKCRSAAPPYIIWSSVQRGVAALGLSAYGSSFASVRQITAPLEKLHRSTSHCVEPNTFLWLLELSSVLSCRPPGEKRWCWSAAFMRQYRRLKR